MVAIEMGRLVLREFALEDYEADHAHASDPRGRMVYVGRAGSGRTS